MIKKAQLQIAFAMLVSVVAMFAAVTGGTFAIAQSPVPASSGSPVGTVTPFAGSQEPSGWLFADGRTVSATEYPELCGVLGSTYGNAPTGQCKLPDMRGRVAVGTDGPAGRLSANDALGEAAGKEDHTLTIAEIPSHSHSVSDPGHSHSVSGNTSTGGAHSHNWLADQGYFLVGSGGQGLKAYAIGGSNAFQGGFIDTQGSHSHSVSGTAGNASAGVSVNSSGGGEAHNNMQPYLTLNQIIRAEPGGVV